MVIADTFKTAVEMSTQSSSSQAPAIEPQVEISAEDPPATRSIAYLRCVDQSFIPLRDCDEQVDVTAFVHIFVSNIPATVTLEQFTGYFSQFGPLAREPVIGSDPNNHDSQLGLVTYETLYGARWAYDQDQKLVWERHIRTAYVVPVESNTQDKKPAVEGFSEPPRTPHTPLASYFGWTEACQRTRANASQSHNIVVPNPYRDVYVRNLPVIYNTTAIKHLFSSAGRVYRVQQLAPHESWTRGDVRITFNTASGAQAAMRQFDRQLIGMQRIRLSRTRNFPSQAEIAQSLEPTSDPATWKTIHIKGVDPECSDHELRVGIWAFNKPTVPFGIANIALGPQGQEFREAFVKFDTSIGARAGLMRMHNATFGGRVEYRAVVEFVP